MELSDLFLKISSERRNEGKNIFTIIRDPAEFFPLSCGSQTNYAGLEKFLSEVLVDKFLNGKDFGSRRLILVGLQDERSTEEWISYDNPSFDRSNGIPNRKLQDLIRKNRECCTCLWQ